MKRMSVAAAMCLLALTAVLAIADAAEEGSNKERKALARSIELLEGWSSFCGDSDLLAGAKAVVFVPRVRRFGLVLFGFTNNPQGIALERNACGWSPPRRVDVDMRTDGLQAGLETSRLFFVFQDSVSAGALTSSDGDEAGVSIKMPDVGASVLMLDTDLLNVCQGLGTNSDGVKLVTVPADLASANNFSLGYVGLAQRVFKLAAGGEIDRTLYDGAADKLRDYANGLTGASADESCDPSPSR